ncbi:MAG: ribonuclease HII [Deltaproteobacteria bacterium]|nr:ribonuclease HII [Deltaproteobacteria bacterium]MBI2974329.1 ribonuclease HII [Deltaproteobacteria bacterium]
MRQKLLFQLPKIDQSYFEENLYKEGIASIAGVDEVGRGCLAGPVVAASVILRRECKIEGINDSKKLSPKKRDELYDVILKQSVACGIGLVDSVEIDRINILQAAIKAMEMAVESLSVKPQYLLIDGNQRIELNIPQKIIIKGDMRSISVGAASIVAKVARDRMMAELEKKYPEFKFSVHKGYGTKQHLEELLKFGPTEIHRKTFAPICKRSACFLSLLI